MNQEFQIDISNERKNSDLQLTNFQTDRLEPLSLMQPSEMALIIVVGMVRFSTKMALTAALTLRKGYILLFRVMAVIWTPGGGTQQNTRLSPSLNIL